jgi:thiol-disulfide isomerase/thioredoxin
MKTIISVFFILISFTAAAQQYEISQDTKHPEVKVLRGIINKYLIQNDTGYKWYATNQKLYKPDTAILTTFEKNRSKLQFVLFGGTWCDDTQYILPQFFKIQELSGVPDSSITFFGVNRAKKSLSNISDAFGITNVPTIIVMKNGKEAGRVVEYGKTGKWDKELAAIINDAK